MAKRTLLVSFDLEDGDPEDYDAVYEVLNAAGLSRWSPVKDLRMPGSTVMGDSDLPGAAKEVREALLVKMNAASGRKVSSLAVAIVDDWAVHGTALEAKSFNEVASLLARRVFKRYVEKRGV